MKLLVFTVHDVATEAFMQPFFARSKGEAIRSFSTAVNSEDHQFSKHAEDYTLFQIGEYDDSDGSLVACTPLSLGAAVEFRVRDDRQRQALSVLKDREAAHG